jgi:hypothetical protein
MAVRILRWRKHIEGPSRRLSYRSIALVEHARTSTPVRAQVKGCADGSSCSAQAGHNLCPLRKIPSSSGRIGQVTVGYSGTPLSNKLGVKADMSIALLSAPDNVLELLEPMPEGVSITRRLGGHKDLVMLFTTRQADLSRRLLALRQAVAPDGMIWVAWPKRASKVPTDMTEDVVREIVLPTGLVDVKVCAIDATWSGLKLVIRKALR